MTREEELKYLKGFLKCELCDEMSCKTCDNRKIGSSPKCYDAFKMAIEALEQEQDILFKIFCIVHPLSIMSTTELEHKAIMQIAEMLEPLCLPESEVKE